MQRSVQPVALIEAKASRYGKEVVTPIGFPVEQDVLGCGHVVGKLPLTIRAWSCPSCGTAHDRDINAAQNILAVGQTVSAHGVGEVLAVFQDDEPPGVEVRTPLGDQFRREGIPGIQTRKGCQPHRRSKICQVSAI